MAKNRKESKVSYQVHLIPAKDASVDTESYHELVTGRFLVRVFMKFGWGRGAFLCHPPFARARTAPAPRGSDGAGGWLVV